MILFEYGGYMQDWENNGQMFATHSSQTLTQGYEKATFNFGSTQLLSKTN